MNVASVPYALSRFSRIEHLDALILSHRDDALYQGLALQAIFGGASFSGRMPVGAGAFLEAGEGISSGPATRLGYASPLDEGLHPDPLMKMEDIIILSC